MQLVYFDREQEIPIVDAVIFGPRRSERVKLVFDTGCGCTLIDTPLIESVGYSAKDAVKETAIQGPVGN